MRAIQSWRISRLGIGRLGLLRCGLTSRRQDHEEVSTLEQRLALDHRERLSVIRDAIEDPPTDILVDHLAAPEHDRHLDLFSCFEELTQTLELGLEIVLGDFRSQLHLLQLGHVLLAPLVFLLLDGLELVASVINQAADGRGRLRGHLDEVEALLVCDPKRGIQGKRARLVVLVVDQPHFGAPDLIVDPQLFKRYGTLPRPNAVLLYSSVHIKNKTDSSGRPSPASAPCARPAATLLGRTLRVRAGALLQSVDGTGKRNPTRTMALALLMGTPHRRASIEKIGALIALAVAAAACSVGGTNNAARHSPSASPTQTASTPPTSQASSTPAPLPVTSPYGVLVGSQAAATYSISLVGADGKVAASAEASTPVVVSCANAAGAPVPLPVSTSNSRAYYMDAQGVVRFIAPNGDAGRATTVTAGPAPRPTLFTARPAGQPIAVVVNDYTANGASTRMYVEDLNGGGNHPHTYSPTRARAVWAGGRRGL